jgi:predicted Zn-dependent protease
MVNRAKPFGYQKSGETIWVRPDGEYHNMPSAMTIWRMLPLLAAGFLISGLPQLAAQNNAQRIADLENIGKRDINKGTTNFTSLAKELEMGRLAATEFEQNRTFVSDSLVKDYVDRVAQNIEKNSDSPFPIAIKVVQASDLNAYALPGGFIYVTSGAIRTLDNEAELAFLIGQMVGHVAARHATENNAKGLLIQALSIPPTTITTGGVAGTAIQQEQQLAIPMSMLRFSKTAVKEADLLGLEYMFKAGYDPAAAVSFFKKIQALEPLASKKQDSLFDTHPPTADRIALTEKNIKTVLPVRTENRMNTPEFDAIKIRLLN